MQERDALSLGANARRRIDQTNSSSTAAFECGVDIVYGETDVMQSRAALLEKFANRRDSVGCFKKFNERFAGAKASDARTVRIIEL